MRIILALFLAVGLCACAHSPDTSQRARCPDSEMASQCNSGGLKCEVDEKRSCDLCRCERMVF